MNTLRLTAAQAMVRYLANQMNEEGERFLAGSWAIFGHGNVAGMGEALAAVTPPGLDHFFYGTGGADANENAVKMARGVTGRHKVLARYRSYHGATFGAITLTGDPRRWASEPGMSATTSRLSRLPSGSSAIRER